MFKALYYPYARCLNQDTLKRAVLLFDEIVFVDTEIDQAPADYNILYNKFLGRDGPALAARWEAIRHTYDLLLEESIIRFHDIRETAKKKEMAIVPGIYSDINDSEFRRICSETNTIPSWRVPNYRIPHLLFSWVNNVDLHPEAQRLIERTIPYSNDLQERTLVPFLVGTALYLNQCILVCEEEGLSPVTDSIVHHNLLMRKYERAIQYGMDVSSNLINSYSPIDLQKVNLLALNILNHVLPEEELARRSFKEIIKYRKNSSEELNRLRIELFRLVSSIETEPWKSKFHKECLKIIDREIIPEIQRTIDNLQAIYEKIFGDFLSSAIQKAAIAITPTLMISILTGMSLGEIAALSTGSVLGAVSMSIPQLINLWRNKKLHRRNSLIYLINLSNEKLLSNRLNVQNYIVKDDTLKLNQLTESTISEHINNTIKPLILALGEKDKFVREKASSFLLDRYQFIKSGGDMYTKKESAARQKYFNKLEDACDQSVITAITKGIKCSDPIVRTCSIFMAEVLKVKELCDLIVATIKEDERREIRRWGVYVLGQLQCKNALDLLFDFAKDSKDWEVQNAAIEVIKQMKDDKQVVEFLVDIIKSKNKIKPQAIRILGSINDQQLLRSQIGILIKILRYGDHYEQNSAAKVLGYIGDHKAIEPLVNAAKYNFDCHVRLNAGESLLMIDRTIGFEIATYILKNDSYKYNRVNTCHALGRIKDATANKIILHVAQNDQSTLVRKGAVEELGRIGDKDIVPPLIDIVNDDPNEGVRIKAIDILTNMYRDQMGEKRIVRLLINKLKNDTNEGVRVEIVKILSRMPSNEIVNVLIKTMKFDSHEKVRQEAIDALGEIGNPIALPPLLKVLEDESTLRQYHTAKALGKIKSKKAVKPLLDSLKVTKDTLVLYNLSEALIKIADVRMIRILIDMIESRKYKHAHGYIARILGEVGNKDDKKIISALIKALNDALNYYEQKLIVEALEKSTGCKFGKISWCKSPLEIQKSAADIYNEKIVEKWISWWENTRGSRGQT